MATPGSRRDVPPTRESCLNGARAGHRWAWRYRRTVFQMVVMFHVLSGISAVPTIVPTTSGTSGNLTSSAVGNVTREHTPAVVSHRPTTETPKQPEKVQVVPAVRLGTSKQPIAPPSFNRNPENKSVVVGGKVTFRCQPVGQDLTVSWEKDGSLLSSDRYIIKSNFNLRIPNVSTSDHGMYRCRAENAGGVAYSGPAFLDVQVPARILDRAQNLNVTYGTMVNLTCQATGNPKPTITWSKNRDMIKDWSTNPPTIWRKQYLTINATSSENYTCQARNTLTYPDGKEEPQILKMRHSVRVYNIPNYCAIYRGHVCGAYLSGRFVFVDADLFNPLSTQEPMLKSLTDQVDTFVKDERCNTAFKSLLCHSMLPDCTGSKPQPKPLCREDCIVVHSELCHYDWVELNKSRNQMLLKRLQAMLGASSCGDLPSKEAAPGTCTDAQLFEMQEDQVTRDCVENGGQYYQGHVSVTNTGLPCLPWTSSVPQSKHMYLSVYPELVNSSNYCRNPGGMYRGPGCFPEGANTEWQPCRIPSCDAETKGSTTSPPKQPTSPAVVEMTESDAHVELPTDAPDMGPVPITPSNKRDIYLICGGASAGVCFVFIVAVAILCRRYRYGRYSRYKYPGDFDISRLPENPMYGKDFNKSFNPHLRHLEYPRNSIIYIVDIGEGAFGRVFKAIAPRLLPEEQSTTVAVKMLKANADRDVQEYFNREAEIIARFDHANVIKLLGVCFVGKPLCLLLEYMGQGDLQEFLHYHSPDKQNGTGGSTRLNNRTQLNLAYQVACGMVYLTEKRFVHRDIATRNCLVGNNNEVKISDFGLARYLGLGDHFLGHKDETIPIRWTAPEALWNYKFTTYSDVWSFGVLLWEIFSYAKQPYENMTHEEVFLQTYKGHRLECPEKTPRCVYELIQMCCSQDLSARPSFYMVRDTLEAMQDGELVC